MIAGSVTDSLEPVVGVHLEGPEGQCEVVSAAIDTGFNRFISLPPEVIARLALPYSTNEYFTLADGSEALFRIFLVVVQWNSQHRLVPAVESDGGALIGMSLLQGSRVQMDVVENGPIRIELLEQNSAPQS